MNTSEASPGNHRGLSSVEETELLARDAAELVKSYSPQSFLLGAAEIVTDNRCLGEEASWGLLELAADLLPRA